tara:strand:- start:1051 stop:1587 length:537 start_codon:yes stop_codon:yes gene_type:complete
MIITCKNCNKRFNVDANVIPQKGRLLQCSSCNHEWFFKKEIVEETIPKEKVNESHEEIKPFNDDIDAVEIKSSKSVVDIERQIKDYSTIEKILINKDNDRITENKDDIFDTKIDNSKNKGNFSILGFIIVFILSFIALIIVLDTFQGPISKIVPNVELLLYNLYETINDIVLFLKDLI